MRAARVLRPLRRSLARLGPRSLAPRQIRVVWTEDPARRLGIAWQSRSKGANPCVELRSVGESSWRRYPAQSIVAPGPQGFLHHCETDDLEPGREYDYRVFSDARVQAASSAVHRTRTASLEDDAPLTVAFFADSAVVGRRDGCSEAAQRVIEELASDDPFLLLGGGDYVSVDRDDRFVDPAAAIDAWFEQMEPLFARSIFMPAFGNHDVGLGERYADWAPRFRGAPRASGVRSQSFDLGPAHFCSLFAPGWVPDPQELEWLDRDLARSRQRGARWLIIYQHAPIFSHGASHPARDRVREALVPLFEAHGVDLHLSAHDQNYERTAPLREAGTKSAEPIVVDPATYRADEGVVYAKVSPFGKLSNRGGGFSRFAEPPAHPVVARNDDCHHYALLRIERDRLGVEIVGVPEQSGPRRSVDRLVLEGR
jgi:hypothetical protein